MESVKAPPRSAPPQLGATAERGLTSLRGLTAQRGLTSQCGFTVIELMLTVVIAAVLAAIAVPSFNDLILSTRIKNGASDIYGALVLARSEAIKRSTNVTVTPKTGGWVNGWKVEVVVSGTTTLLREQDVLSKLKVECPLATNCADTLTFQRNGRLTSTATTSIVVDDATPPATRRVPLRCVSISVSGQVNVLVDNNLDGSCSNG